MHREKILLDLFTEIAVVEHLVRNHMGQIQVTGLNAGQFGATCSSTAATIPHTKETCSSATAPCITPAVTAMLSSCAQTKRSASRLQRPCERNEKPRWPRKLTGTDAQ